MGGKRKSISKKTRFEVFKRDSFTCQYCGRSSPEVVLEIDHINPVKNGGDNDIMNLITSCFDCNRGKGKRTLGNNEVIKKQTEQLKMLNAKKEQLEMMLEWRKELLNFEEKQVDEIENFLLEKTGSGFSEYGRKQCKKNIKEFGFEEVYESAIISVDQYFEEGNEESITKAFNYIKYICRSRKNADKNPNAYKINYLCKMGENEFNYFDKFKIRKYLQNNFEEEDFEVIKEMIIISKNYTQFKENLWNFYGEEV